MIRWRLHLASPPQRVFELLATDAGRARFWAESAEEHDGAIDFVFPDGLTWRGEILASEPGERFTVRYLGGSRTTFRLLADDAGGTDLELTDEEVRADDAAEITPGWVSILLALKAAADFDVDLRNHDPDRTWDQGYCDN